MGQADATTGEAAPGLTELQDRLAAIVEREVKAAHGDILKDLAESELARKEAELAVSDLRRELAIAREELNALRGIRTT